VPQTVHIVYIKHTAYIMCEVDYNGPVGRHNKYVSNTVLKRVEIDHYKTHATLKAVNHILNLKKITSDILSVISFVIRYKMISSKSQ